MAKRFDVVATTGTYVKDGVTKYLSKNVGEVIETKNGLAIKMDATFNPAGCKITEDGKIWLKLFEPREQVEKMQNSLGAAPRNAPAPADDGFTDDELPPF